jgi:hypothetical protein
MSFLTELSDVGRAATVRKRMAAGSWNSLQPLSERYSPSQKNDQSVSSQVAALDITARYFKTMLAEKYSEIGMNNVKYHTYPWPTLTNPAQRKIKKKVYKVNPLVKLDLTGS